MSSDSRASLGAPNPSRGSQERRKASVDDYIFGKLLGEGSFSSVFLAKDTHNQREVAIKVCDKRQILKEKMTEYIHREKDILRHITEKWDTKFPYFVRLYATFSDRDRLYFVLTYAKNRDFFKFIAKLTANAIDCTQFYAAELVAAVGYLHNQGIIHRDLKPENILLNENMHILITDFGSAKMTRRKRRRRRTGDNREEPVESDDRESLTSDEDDEDELPGGSGPPKPKRSSFVGTPEYVSPEIFSSRGSSRASDLWAIGCIIYQMISGIPPFQSKSQYMIFKKIEKLEYSFHEGFDENAKDLIKRLLVIEPKERIGATDKKYYDSIESHAFFKGVDFDNLQNSPPAAIASFVKDGDLPDPIWAKIPDATPGVSRMLELLVGHGTSSDDELPDHSPTETENGPIFESSKFNKRSKKSVLKPFIQLNDEERNAKLKVQSLTNDFHKFVEGHLILKQGILDKRKGLFAKRRMFLLTEGPHLYYVDPTAMVLKGEIPWSAVLKTEIKDFRIFFVHVPGRAYYLIDPDSTSKDWCAAIEEVKEYYFGKDAGDDKADTCVSSTTAN